MYKSRSSSHLSLALPPSEPEPDIVTPAPPAPALAWHCLVLGGLAAGSIAGVYFGSGLHLAEKVLKALASPLGVAWVMLFLAGYYSLLHRRLGSALVVLLAWGLLTVAGNQLFSRWIVATLEGPYLASNFAKLGPFDLVLVLGGGTSVTPQGDPQLDWGGDRLMLAARLYHAGKVERVIVSGSQFTRTSELDLEPGEESKLLLVQVGVPEDRISVIRGLNTAEEMRALNQWLEANTSAPRPRLGIITSAWHLPRAMRLASANQIEATPVPANFHTVPFIPSPHLVIPSGENLFWTQVAVHEYLGRFIGR